MITQKIRLKTPDVRLAVFLEKLGLKSAREYGWKEFTGIFTGSNLKVTLNGVPVKYVQGANYDISDIGLINCDGLDD